MQKKGSDSESDDMFDDSFVSAPKRDAPKRDAPKRGAATKVCCNENQKKKKLHRIFKTKIDQ